MDHPSMEFRYNSANEVRGMCEKIEDLSTKSYVGAKDLNVPTSNVHSIFISGSFEVWLRKSFSLIYVCISNKTFRYGQLKRSEVDENESQSFSVSSTGNTFKNIKMSSKCKPSLVIVQPSNLVCF